MKTKLPLRRLAKLPLTVVLAVSALPVLAQQPTIPERVAALKATLEASRTVLKQYQWVQTTVVSVNGEEKSRKQDECYYGADGSLTKIEMNASPEPERRRGLRGRIEERKREEMTDYMKEAVELVKSYVPPKPALLQSAKDSGNVTLDILDPGKRVRLNFRNYLKPGDTLAAEVDLTNNHLVGLSVKTYLADSPDKPVDLTARFGTLDEGTTYPSAATLSAPAKNLQVQVTNSGYRKND